MDTFIDKMSELFGVADVIAGFNSKLAATVQVIHALNQHARSLKNIQKCTYLMQTLQGDSLDGRSGSRDKGGGGGSDSFSEDETGLSPAQRRDILMRKVGERQTNYTPMNPKSAHENLLTGNL